MKITEMYKEMYKPKGYTAAEKKRLKMLREKTFQTVCHLTVSAAVSREPIPYEKKDSLKYTPVRPGNIWGKKMYQCAWFHVTAAIPPKYRGQHLLLHIDVGGEGLIYTNSGEPYEMLSIKIAKVDEFSLEKGKTTAEVSDAILKDGRIDCYIDAGFNGSFLNMPFGVGIFEYADLVLQNDECYDLYYDYLAVLFLKAVLPESEQAPLTDALDRAFEMILADRYDEAREILQTYIKSTPDDFTLYAVGHSHLDLAWLWPLRETKRKSVRTFTKQLNNIRRYPGYIYGASQPQQFEWIKKTRPAFYAQIREAVAKREIELQGGMWVEADTNLPGGEALIRQLYYGKRFFREEFGQEMEICWLPDVFGYNGNLPQILSKSGIPYFFTIKLSWNEHNNFPYRSFNWTGIDGSRVLVHMAPDETYNSECLPYSTLHARDNYPEKDVSNEALYVYGVGDGGGGPGEVFIELLKRQERMYKIPSVRFSPAIDYFKKLETYRDKLPNYTGELYLEKHQGTYTTQGRNKRFNRLCEYALADAETLCAMAYLRGREYDQEKFDDWWKEVLLYQFHDIIPGSAVGRVYDESLQRYAIILAEINAEKTEALRWLSGDGNNEFAYNPTSFARDESVNGKSVCVAPFAAAPLQERQGDSELRITENTMSNSHLRVIFNKNGEIASMKGADGFEYSKGYLNRLVLFFDRPMMFNAWDIDWKYHRQKGITLKAYRHELKKKPDRVTRVNYYRHGRTTIRQEVSLGADDDYLTVNTHADYHELFGMLRAEFIPSVFSNEVACDIQYGTIRRSTKDETLIERAQFEICAHKYVDVSDNERGFSLLNDCKYGHRVKDGLISLNLLRSPVFPDPKADRGMHEFKYALYPHTDALSVETLKRACALNRPLILYRGKSPVDPIATVDNENVVIEVMKKAYGDNALVLRLYESQGLGEQASLCLNFDFKAVKETDLMEEQERDIDIDCLTFSPYEIKTVKVYI